MTYAIFSYWRRQAMVAVLLMTLLSLAGCEAFAFAAATATGRDKIKAVYTLPNRSTAIVVDDPYNRLGSPTMAGIVESNVAFHLKQNQAVTARIATQREVAAVRTRLGEEYALTPIDQIGRLLDVEQVIYIQVEQAALKIAPGAYRPSAQVELKVIDATRGERMYPPPPPISEPGAPSRGRSVVVELNHQRQETDRGNDALLARKLSERLGLQIARYFYDHRKDPTFD